VISLCKVIVWVVVYLIATQTLKGEKKWL